MNFPQVENFMCFCETLSCEKKNWGFHLENPNCLTKISYFHH